MPTPYERSPSAADAEAAAPQRPTLHRPAEGRIVAGVCAGLAEHLGWDVRLVRLGFILLTLPGGAGLVAYLFLWALTPQSVGGSVERGDGQVLSAPPSTRRNGPRPARCWSGVRCCSSAWSSWPRTPASTSGWVSSCPCSWWPSAP
jgi:phage shock protein PspC (stress-responsive transcriptional regulator)